MKLERLLELAGVELDEEGKKKYLTEFVGDVDDFAGDSEDPNRGETETGTWELRGDELVVTHFDVTDARGNPEEQVFSREDFSGKLDWSEGGLEVDVSGSDTHIVWGGEVEYIIPTSVYRTFTQS